MSALFLWPAGSSTVTNFTLFSEVTTVAFLASQPVFSGNTVEESFDDGSSLTENGTPTSSTPVNPWDQDPDSPTAGWATDPDTGLVVNPETGAICNPRTGEPLDVDPNTGQYTDPTTGLEVDPVTGLPINDEGQLCDPVTGQPLPVDGDGNPISPIDQQPIDTDQPVNENPTSEMPIDQETWLSG